MSDIRLMERTYAIDGREYILRCNMNVLADVQEANGGELLLLLDGEHLITSTLTFAAAMLNDYADEQGWPERFTRRTLGRKIKPLEMTAFVSLVSEIVRSSVGIDDVPDDEAALPPPSDEATIKNA